MAAPHTQELNMFLSFVLVVGLVFGFPALPEYAIDPAIEQIHDAKVFS
jgi:hypothetical protein